MRGGELVLALVVENSLLIYIYSKSQEPYCWGRTTKNRKNNLAFKYLVDISCCQDGDVPS